LIYSFVSIVLLLVNDFQSYFFICKNSLQVALSFKQFFYFSQASPMLHCRKNMVADNGSTVWLVADFKAHSYQVTTTLDAG